MIEAFYPVEAQPGNLWVEWFEALLSNGCLLVRCIPIPAFALPDGTKSVLLNFGPVVAFRATQDPYAFSEQENADCYPREANGNLSSPFMRAIESNWIEQSRPFFNSPIAHFILVSAQDQSLEVLTSRHEPGITMECGSEQPNPYPDTFRVPAMNAKGSPYA